MHDNWQRRFIDRFYSTSSGFVGGTTEFHELCKAQIPPGSRILEIGAGGQNPTTEFLATIGELHGVDIDPAILRNPGLSKRNVISNDEYPYTANTFDACVSNYVVEHLTDPIAHLMEVNRVLRPSGTYIFRTPNLFHYVALVSRYSPHWFHLLVANRLRNLPIESHQPFSTIYKMNTANAINLLSKNTGFIVDLVRMVEKEPSYGMSSRALFLLFMLYERIVNCSERLSIFRSNIFCILRK